MTRAIFPTLIAILGFSATPVMLIWEDDIINFSLFEQCGYAVIVARGPRQYKQMPDLVKPKVRREWIRTFGGVDNRSDRVENSTGEEPGQTITCQTVGKWINCGYGDPAHEDI